jgi:preprotein translocase subunit SecG
MLKVISALALFLLVLLQNSAYAARCEGQEGRIIFEDDFTDDAGGWVADIPPSPMASS